MSQTVTETLGRVKRELTLSPSICAIFITYNPDESAEENIVAVSSQVGCVVVVDNGSDSEAQILLDKIQAKTSCHVIRNLTNLGIAAALNRGIEYAYNRGVEWVATFDQDSYVSEGFFCTMLDALSHLCTPHNVALISPTYVDRESGHELRLHRSRDGRILTTMTSGSMTPTAVFHKVGLFDETLFIDAVDTEFCLRIRAQQMEMMQSSAILFHSLGRTTFHHLGKIRFAATNHSPARRYYITRNRWLLLMRYAGDFPWLWREFRAMLFETAKIILVEKHKWKKLEATVLGTLHAFQGKAGKQIEI